MPLIEPFQALRYNPTRVGSLARVVTPPYDVISDASRNGYYRAHPNNFIRVIYGKGRSSDRAGKDRYTRASAALRGWIRKGVLALDAEPAVYPYEQEYRIGGKIHRRLGLIALVPLDETVYPHEQIFGGPKQDRMELMKQVNGALDPIFGLVPDARGDYRRSVSGACRGRRPVAAFRFQEVRHRLWRITDPVLISKLSKVLRSKKLVIADGHHRFEAARSYRDERKRNDPSFSPRVPYNFVMFYLSAAGADDPGLLPTHRLLKPLPAARAKALLQQAKAKGAAQPVRSMEALTRRLRSLRGKEQVGVGLYTGNGAGYLLRPPAGTGFKLDVEWLHEGLLKDELENISYSQNLEAACGKVRSGEAQAVFVMQPPRLKDVFGRALASRRMPRKTTYFYPKLVSGLVGYLFDDKGGSS